MRNFKLWLKNGGGEGWSTVWHSGSHITTYRPWADLLWTVLVKQTAICYWNHFVSTIREIMCLIQGFLYLTISCSKCLSWQTNDCRGNWGAPDPLWNLIFNYSDLIILLPFCLLFTADRKNPAGWLVGNSMIKQTVTFIYEASPD